MSQKVAHNQFIYCLFAELVIAEIGSQTNLGTRETKDPDDRCPRIRSHQQKVARHRTERKRLTSLRKKNVSAKWWKTHSGERTREAKMSSTTVNRYKYHANIVLFMNLKLIFYFNSQLRTFFTLLTINSNNIKNQNVLIKQLFMNLNLIFISIFC